MKKSNEETPKLMVDDQFNLERWQFCIELNRKKHFCPKSEGLEISIPDESVSWRIRIDERDDHIIVDSTITNDGVVDVRLGRVSVMLLDKGGAFAVPTEQTVVLVERGNQVPKNLYRLTDEECPDKSLVLAQFHNTATSMATQVGFLSFDRAAVAVDFTCSVADGVLELDAYCDFGGLVLKPGRSVKTETLRLLVGRDPRKQLEDWARKIAEKYPPPDVSANPFGWVGWAWKDAINSQEGAEKMTYGNLDAINKRLAGFGCKYVWISISNLEGGQPGNWLNWNYSNFPSGPETFFSEVQKRGFRPGLWNGPFYMSSMLKDKIEEFKDALLRNPDDSYLVVKPSWSHGDSGKLPLERRPDIYALDPTHPKSKAFIRDVYQTLEKWGIRYYMVDFLDAGAGNILHHNYEDRFDPEMVPGPEAFRSYLKIVKEAAGEETYLLGSSGPILHNAGILDAVRVGPDFGEGRPINPQSYYYPASYLTGSLESARNTLRNQAGYYFTHRKLFVNDSANLLTVDQPLPLNHARIHSTIHAFSGGPTMLGDDIREIGEDRLELIRTTLPRSTACGVPLDLFDNPFPDHARMFWRKIEKDGSRYDVVAIYNLNKEPYEFTLDFERIGLDSEKAYAVWEFWNQEYLGDVTSRFTDVLPRESVRVYRFAENQGTPLVLGTDMHVMMGEMELNGIHWDNRKLILSGHAERPLGCGGNVFVLSSNNLSINDAFRYWISKDHHTSNIVTRIKLDFSSKSQIDWDIAFTSVDDVTDSEKMDLL